MIRYLLTFCALFFFCGAAAAQTKPAVGTRFAPSTGGYYEVVAVEGTDVVIKNNAGTERRWVGGFVLQPAKAGEEEYQKIRSLHPLAPGKSVEFDISGPVARGGSAAIHNVVKVLRAETVQVPAGRFETLVVEWNERNLSQGSRSAGTASWIRTYWYAPSLGFVVKFDYREEGPVTPQRNQPWELKSISRPK